MDLVAKLDELIGADTLQSVSTADETYKVQPSTAAISTLGERQSLYLTAGGKRFEIPLSKIRAINGDPVGETGAPEATSTDGQAEGSPPPEPGADGQPPPTDGSGATTAPSPAGDPPKAKAGTPRASRSRAKAAATGT